MYTCIYLKVYTHTSIERLCHVVHEKIPDGKTRWKSLRCHPYTDINIYTYIYIYVCVCVCVCM